MPTRRRTREYPSEFDTLATGRLRPFDWSRRTIAFVEPASDYSHVVPALTLRDDLRFAKIFCPSVAHAEQLTEAADADGVDIRPRLIRYNTINPRIDPDLYRFCGAIAARIFSVARNGASETFGDADHFVAEDLQRACTVQLMDQLAAMARPFLEFAEAAKADGAERVVYFPRPSYEHRAKAALLRRLLTPVPIESSFAHWSKGAFKALSRTRRPAEATIKPMVNIRPDYPAPAGLAPSGVFMCVSTRNHVYLESVLPIARGLLASDAMVTVYEYSGGGPDGTVAEQTFGAAADIAIHTKSTPGYARAIDDREAAFLKSVCRRARHAVQALGGVERGFADVTAFFVARNLLPLLLTARARARRFDLALENASAVVVLPGRGLDPSVLVACAQRRGVPTIEVQSAMISPGPRYVAPAADELLAIDPHSKRIFVEAHGAPARSVRVVGSAKIDAHLGPVRDLTLDQARAQTRAFDGLGRETVILLATQPVELATMRKVVRMTLGGLRRALPEAHVRLKLHPNEPRERADIYAGIARSIGFENFKDAGDEDALRLIAASDLVATYFSMVGLEAFALAKPAISINPYDAPPPFDLAALGVALEARTEAELAEHLTAWRDGAIRPAARDRDLAYLQDGRAVERIVGHILERARGRDLKRAVGRLRTIATGAVSAKSRTAGGPRLT